MCVLSIKVPIQKKSGNLFNDPRMYKKDLALNNLQWLICYKTKPNQTKPSHISTDVWLHYQNSNKIVREKA